MPAQCSNNLSLQDLIPAWHDNSEGRWALTSNADLVLLQLDRFHLSSGIVVKNMEAISLSANMIVSLPCFEARGLATRQVHYRIVAAMLHLGPMIAVGHYVCIWLLGPHLIYLDDLKATVLSRLSSEQLSNLYLLLAIRCDDGR